MAIQNLSALFSFQELVDVIIMSLAFGFIFKDFIKSPKQLNYYDVNLDIPTSNKFKRFNWTDFWYASMIVTPAVFFHEMGHKFTAMLLGYNAVFHAPYTWLAIAIILKILHSPFIFLVGGYVSMQANITNTARMLISFAGPFVNLIFWIGSMLLLKNKNFVKKYSKHIHSLAIFKKLNMFLFIFNMIPIPGFDGFSFFSALFRIIF